MIPQNPKTRRLIIGIPAFLLIAAIVLFSIRGILLRKMLQVATGKFGEHHYIAHFDGARFSGIRSVFIREIYIKGEKNSNEIGLDSLHVRVRLLPLLFKTVRVRKIECSALHVRYEPGKGDSVVATKTKEPSADLFGKITGTDLAGQAHNYIRRFFRYLPAKADIGLIDARVIFEGKTTLVSLNELHLLHGRFSCNLVFSGEGKSDRIPLEGRLDRSSYVVQLALKNTGEPLLPIPFLRDKYGMETGFDSIAFQIDLSDHASNQVNLKGSFLFTGFELLGERLSTTGISVDQVKAQYLLHISPHAVELDSTSSGELNRISILPYLKVDMEAGPRIILKLRPVTWEAADFYSSLPSGMFTSVNGMKAEGKLHYSMGFDVDLRNPDSLKFVSRLSSKDLRIVAFGNDDYRKLNGNFYHEVFERGHLKASFTVGNENPDFVPFEEISPFLRAAVMTSEDGSFFYHNGFNAEAFRESIVTNIREKRFARGGSTITMQLVKNVFLTRNKTIARKIEEALIVWLIENRNLVSKQRMYEVYLNLIEWGPGIYGINQASHYYFDKKPSALNLEESIYLASIVPHPKWYKFTFETNGIPKPFFINYFHRMEHLMVHKQFIAETDTVGANTAIMLTGPAADAFAVPDTVRADSLILQELEIIPATVE
jgi:hypothetical protein